MSSDSTSYRDAGVDIDAATEAKRRIAAIVRKTFSPNVLTDIGHFGAMFQLDVSAYRQPVLVSSIDSVGTKLKVAVLADRHSTVGIDIVSHCVNDILVQGAAPLFFLDYLAFGRLKPGVVEELVRGLAEGCLRAGCALIGGETAELPGLYADNEYDLAGCIVGIAEREKIIDGSAVRRGDVLLGLGSDGLHTNGYSLARHLLFHKMEFTVDSFVEEIGCTVGEELLKTHRCYGPSVRPLLDASLVHGMAHITGGGITDNLPRSIPRGLSARIEKSAWPVPPIFELLRRIGNVEENEMLRTFNMGIGYILIAAPEKANEITKRLISSGERVYRIGEIVTGEQVQYV